jgi:hypothetical protein
VVNPVPAGPDWLSSDVRMRRDANAYAYRQSSNPSDWNRYVTLGLFTTADCVEFDDIWAAIEKKPLKVHQAIWYNFKFYVDHEYEMPEKLNEWAMNVSLPFLKHHHPAFIDVDTMENDRGLAQYFADNKNPDPPDEWLPVLEKRKRPKSPPPTPPRFQGLTQLRMISFVAPRRRQRHVKKSFHEHHQEIKSCTVGRPQ